MNTGISKTNFLFVLFFLFNAMNIFSFSVSENYKSEGLFTTFSFSYDNVFEKNDTIINLEFITVSIFPSSKVNTWHIGCSGQFSLVQKMFDLFWLMGFTYYPFEEIFSITGNGEMSFSSFIFNHFTYQLSLKINFDIPINKVPGNGQRHFISLGIGLRHRNAIELFNYLQIDNYYGINNSYFIGIEYRTKFYH